MYQCKGSANSSKTELTSNKGAIKVQIWSNKMEAIMPAVIMLWLKTLTWLMAIKEELERMVVIGRVSRAYHRCRCRNHWLSQCIEYHHRLWATKSMTLASEIDQWQAQLIPFQTTVIITILRPQMAQGKLQPNTIVPTLMQLLNSNSFSVKINGQIKTQAQASNSKGWMSSLEVILAPWGKASWDLLASPISKPWIVVYSSSIRKLNLSRLLLTFSH